ncbi:hypothetical protein [Burkholderia multivorans]|uniref:hypothetical protein n=1 Tax=Burkholderia multivorans TaxID=87883 RepID=UPI0006C77F95|nr:hypothetical protein [Burkholderia multivorans]
MSWLEFKWKAQDFIEQAGNFVTGGMLDRKKSNSIVRGAKERESEARERFEKAREETHAAITALGAVKAEILTTSVPAFIKLVELMGPAALGKRKLKEERLVKQMLTQVAALKDVSMQMSDMMVGGAGGAMGGAALAAGAYGLVGVLGTAGTGTAIGSLSGAAATNATLAWLGGGTLSAGGLGVSGGMAVLGGIAVVPAALVAMYLGQNHAKQKLNAARDFRDQVEVYEEEVKTLVTQLDAMKEGAEIMIDALKGLSAVLTMQTEKMQTVLTYTAARALDLQDALGRELLNQRALLSDEFLAYVEKKQGRLAAQEETA